MRAPTSARLAGVHSALGKRDSMSVQTTTYIHVHVGDEVTVKSGSPVDEWGTIVRLGDLADVALFLDRASALQLAQDILTRYEVLLPAVHHSGHAVGVDSYCVDCHDFLEPMLAAPCQDAWHVDYDDASLAVLIQCPTCQED